MDIKRLTAETEKRTNLSKGSSVLSKYTALLSKLDACLRDAQSASDAQEGLDASEDSSTIKNIELARAHCMNMAGNVANALR